MGLSASELYGELKELEGIEATGFGDEERGNKIVEYVRATVEGGDDGLMDEVRELVRGTDWKSSGKGLDIEFARVVHDASEIPDPPEEKISDDHRYNRGPDR